MGNQARSIAREWMDFGLALLLVASLALLGFGSLSLAVGNWRFLLGVLPPVAVLGCSGIVTLVRRTTGHKNEAGG